MLRKLKKLSSPCIHVHVFIISEPCLRRVLRIQEHTRHSHTKARESSILRYMEPQQRPQKHARGGTGAEAKAAVVSAPSCAPELPLEVPTPGVDNTKKEEEEEEAKAPCLAFADRVRASLCGTHRLCCVCCSATARPTPDECPHCGAAWPQGMKKRRPKKAPGGFQPPLSKVCVLYLKWWRGW